MENEWLLWVVGGGEVMTVAMQPPIDETSVRINVRVDGGIAYLEAAGEIDLQGEKQLRRSVERVLTPRVKSVIFDLRCVRYMDTGALQVLLAAKSRVVAWGGEVYVLVDDPLPKRVIYMANLQSALRVYDSLDEALTEIAQHATCNGGRKEDFPTS